MRNPLAALAFAAAALYDPSTAPRMYRKPSRTRAQKKYRTDANSRRAFALASKRRNRRK